MFNTHNLKRNFAYLYDDLISYPHKSVTLYYLSNIETQIATFAFLGIGNNIRQVLELQVKEVAYKLNLIDPAMRNSLANTFELLANKRLHLVSTKDNDNFKKLLNLCNKSSHEAFETIDDLNELLLYFDYFWRWLLEQIYENENLHVYAFYGLANYAINDSLINFYVNFWSKTTNIQHVLPDLKMMTIDIGSFFLGNDFIIDYETFINQAFWQTDNVKKIVNSFFNVSFNNENYYFGSFTTVIKQVTNQLVVEILDGKQRFIIFLLFAYACLQVDPDTQNNVFLQKELTLLQKHLVLGENQQLTLLKPQAQIDVTHLYTLVKTNVHAWFGKTNLSKQAFIKKIITATKNFNIAIIILQKADDFMRI